MVSDVHKQLKYSRVRYKQYLELCKPRVVLLMVLTSLVGMCLASPTVPQFSLLLFGNLGIGLCAAAAAVINHLADYRIDQIMDRTKKRPVATGCVSFVEAVIWAMLLIVLGMCFLLVYTNVVAAALTFMSVIGYAGIYTFYLKHSTSQNIVIGGLSGAAPPLLGWVAVTGSVHLFPVILVMIIFFWTPPHFWALAIERIDDYKKVNLPMMPVTHGIPYTKRSMIWYTLLLIVTTLLPIVLQQCFLIYSLSVVLLNAWFSYGVLQLYRDDENKNAFAVFKNSIVYLAFLFVFLLLDHYIPIRIF
jgi:heme o synthase